MNLAPFVVSSASLLITTAGTVFAIQGGLDGATAAAALLFTVLLAAAALLLLWREFTSWRPRKFKNNEAIRQFMYEWISHEGRIVIFSNDMSWVGPEPRIKALLLDKARLDDLTICLPRVTSLSEELRSAGSPYCDLPGSELRTSF